MKKHTLNPEITLLNQFPAQKALFKVPKICNINLWIENDPSRFGTPPVLVPPPVPKGLNTWLKTHEEIFEWVQHKIYCRPFARPCVLGHVCAMTQYYWTLRRGGHARSHSSLKSENPLIGKYFGVCIFCKPQSIQEMTHGS